MRNLKLSERKGVAQIFLLIGVLLVAIALPIATRLVQQNQENRSSAASSTIIQDSKCKNAGGTCQKTSSNCSGSYKSGYCPSSGSDIKCCVKGSSGGGTIPQDSKCKIIQDSKCKNAGGTCQKTSTSCSGTKEYKSGYCPSSGSNVKCCAPKNSSGGSTPASGSIVQDSKCRNIGGTCQKTSSSCSGSNEYKGGYCPSSGSDVKCCAPKTSGSTQDTKCTNAGGYCKKVADGCDGGNFLSGYCTSSGSDVKCCVKNTADACTAKGGSCVGSSSTCTNTMGGVVLSASGDCSSTVPVCCKVGGKPTVVPTLGSTGRPNRSACTSDSQCISGKCAMTDDTRTRVCIPASGTVYVCDRYNNDYYSEKWVNGAQVGSGTKCAGICNTSTGLCSSVTATPTSATGCSSFNQAECQKHSNCFLPDDSSKYDCEAKRPNGSDCKQYSWCVSGFCNGASGFTLGTYPTGKCAPMPAATPVPTEGSNVGASCLSTDGSYQAFDESKCKGNTHCDRTTKKCVANTAPTTAPTNGGCSYGGTNYPNGYARCTNAAITNCVNGTWSIPAPCQYGDCRTSSSCVACKEGTSNGCSTGKICYQGTCINSGGGNNVTNTPVCKDKGGVCATFTTALSNGASCKVGSITGIVVTGLCKGDKKTVCCVARAPGINYPTATPTRPASNPTSKPPVNNPDPTSRPPVPTSKPTTAPTAGPTSAAPTTAPTAGPTTGPTAGPTTGPTAGPTTSESAPKISFKFSLRGVKPSYKDGGEDYNCFDDLENLKIDVVNSPTNTYQSGLVASFDVVPGETNVNGDQVFKVTSLSLDSKFASVGTFNYLKVKGPFHLKRRMCLDGQAAKLSETTTCNINLVSNTVYDFSDYTLLAGDVNADGVINSIDYSYVKTRLGADAEISCGREGDLNMDGVVNALDTNLIKESLSSRDDE